MFFLTLIKKNYITNCFFLFLFIVTLQTFAKAFVWMEYLGVLYALDLST